MISAQKFNQFSERFRKLFLTYKCAVLISFVYRLVGFFGGLCGSLAYLYATGRIVAKSELPPLESPFLEQKAATGEISSLGRSETRAGSFLTNPKVQGIRTATDLT